MIPSCSPTPGATPWSSIKVSSRSPSLFIPVNPCSTPKGGVEAVPIAAWGDRPASPPAGTPEYDYDLSTPPSPPDPPKPLPTPPMMPKPHARGCTPRCFNITYSLHHHDHADPPSQQEDLWTSATMVEDQTPQNTKVYTIRYELEPRRERLDNLEEQEQEDDVEDLSVDAVP
ncbi:hypothetical protein EI94DRAFT_1811893 [Lactarius quietus]|nr:hypothetical protein EI94DRAFT_1811893 [Lactarius quietus]